MEEKADYEVLFTFTQENDGKADKRSIYFDTYDTGTITIREQRETGVRDSRLIAISYAILSVVFVGYQYKPSYKTESGGVTYLLPAAIC